MAEINYAFPCSINWLFKNLSKKRGGEIILTSEMPKLNILLAEEDPNVMEIIKLLLKHAGHTVTCCMSRQETFNLLRNNPYDLAIINLGSYGTLEIGKDIIDLNKDIPIILMTGISESEVKEILLKLNSKELHYIAKPILMSDLKSKIESIFSGK